MDIPLIGAHSLNLVILRVGFGYGPYTDFGSGELDHRCCNMKIAID